MDQRGSWAVLQKGAFCLLIKMKIIAKFVNRNITSYFTFLKKSLLLITIVLFFVRCHTNAVDEEKPVITITSPANNQSFAAGQTVNLLASISDNDELHMVHLHVINLATGDHAILFEEHPDAKAYSLNKSFTVQGGVTYDITIEADDHSGNTGLARMQVSGR